MSPMVQALERRRSVNVHGDWDKPIEKLNVGPTSSVTPVDMQHFSLNEQTQDSSKESTTTSSVSSSMRRARMLSIPKKNCCNHLHCEKKDLLLHSLKQ